MGVSSSAFCRRKRYNFNDDTYCFMFFLDKSNVIYTFDLTFLLLLSNDVEKNPGNKSLNLILLLPLKI